MYDAKILGKFFFLWPFLSKRTAYSWKSARGTLYWHKLQHLSIKMHSQLALCSKTVFTFVYYNTLSHRRASYLMKPHCMGYDAQNSKNTCGKINNLPTFDWTESRYLIHVYGFLYYVQPGIMWKQQYWQNYITYREENAAVILLAFYLKAYQIFVMNILQQFFFISRKGI